MPGKFTKRITKVKELQDKGNTVFQKNMGVKFTPKTGPNAGEEVMFRMSPFPQLEDVPEGNKGLPKLPEKVRNNMGFKRYKEDEATGMLRMEELKPLNKMGAVPFQRNEMPMAYKQKVVKKTAGAKAIPFTAK